jgi:hypothetical protein
MSCFYPLGRKVSLIKKMEDADSSETLVPICQAQGTTQQRIADFTVTAMRT